MILSFSCFSRAAQQVTALGLNTVIAFVAKIKGRKNSTNFVV